MSRMNPGMYSSSSGEYETPQLLFDVLDNKYHFTLDPCATPENAKCKKFYTKEDDGLTKPWEGEVVFMNPPYGREIWKWVKKAAMEGRKPNTVVVALLPARTDTRWFHDYVLEYGIIYFLRGRLKFGGTKNSAPFPSMVVEFS